MVHQIVLVVVAAGRITGLITQGLEYGQLPAVFTDVITGQKLEDM